MEEKHDVPTWDSLVGYGVGHLVTTTFVQPKWDIQFSCHLSFLLPERSI